MDYYEKFYAIETGNSEETPEKNQCNSVPGVKKETRIITFIKSIWQNAEPIQDRNSQWTTSKRELAQPDKGIL